MKVEKAQHTLSALLLAGLLTIPAASAGAPGWYLGAGLGQSRADIAEREIREDLQASGFSVSAFTADDIDFGYKLLGGYQFGSHVALEGGFFDLGKFDFLARTQPEGSLAGELQFRGIHLDLLGLLPISERAALLARLGAHHSTARVRYTGSGAVNVENPRFSKDNTDYKFGVGFQYQLAPALALRIEAERFRMDDAVGNQGDLDLYSAGLVYAFARPAPAPAPQRPAPVPAPALVIAPLPGATEEYCSLLDIQFEIARDAIQREEHEKMAVVATYLQRYPNTSAVIEGHTDDVGSDQANQQLSQRRAESVVDYLVSEHRIDRSRLRAMGHGESRPIADNQTETGKRANRRIAAIIGCATDIAGLDPQAARVTLALQIDFDSNSATVKPDYRQPLRKVAEFLATNPTLTATMEGHADNASPDRAQNISRQRAQSVADYLVTQFGVDRSRLRVQGFGETRRFAYNTNAEGRQENRRVNIILGYPD